MHLLKNALAVTLLPLLVSTASAATYTFDLQNLNGNNPDPGDPGVVSGNSLTIDQGDLNGTFTGVYIDNPSYDGNELDGGTVNDAHEVVRFYNGLGVCNVGPCYTNDPLHTVDGTSLNGARHDMVEMAFTSGGSEVDVTLTGLVFGWVGDFQYGYDGTNGSFDILVDVMGMDGIGLGDILAFSGDATDGDVLPGWSIYSYDLSGEGLFDSVFGVMAGMNGSWKLKSVVVDYTVPEIPLPAGIWLMIGGLGGMAALRRRQKAT